MAAESTNETPGFDYSINVVFESLPIPLTIWSNSEQILDCNQAAVDIFKLSSKQEYREKFLALSPEYQPDGQLSADKMVAVNSQAFAEGRVKFEWMHQLLDGTPVPCEVTMACLDYMGTPMLLSYIDDLRELKDTLAQKKEADERTQIMLDATPLCCNLWDENMNNIDCNQEAVKLFDLKNKQEYLDRFFELSPEYQPDGRLSSEAAAENIKMAFDEGRVVFEWMHQKLDGTPVPSEITLVRVKRGDSYIVAGYTRDLREEKRMLAEMREADERAQIMLDATPLCCNFWDENRNNIDCNQEAVALFDLKNKQEYLDRFFELSPEYQPDGRLSSEKAGEMIDTAFSKGRIVFEWMHQKLNGDPIPAEITLVRVKRGDSYIVAGYTRDLRELKNTVERLDQLESLAFTDSGTGVYNRRFFMSRAQQIFANDTFEDSPLAIIMMDLDKFKDINDTYGHLAGDKVLKEIADAAQSVLRPDDVLARYGGEEFVIMIRETKPGVANLLAERIRATIADLNVVYEGTPIHVTISLGVAFRRSRDESLEDVIRLADMKMYQAKQSGRNQVRTS